MKVQLRFERVLFTIINPLLANALFPYSLKI